jgi:hypothetical protein
MYPPLLQVLDNSKVPYTINWVISHESIKIKHTKIKQTPKIKMPKLTIVNGNEPMHKYK